MDCSLPGSSVHGMFQARILEWVAISCFRGSSGPRDQTHISSVSCIDWRILYHWATWEDLSSRNCWLKKICTTYKLRIVFYLVYFEDLSPGGSLSDCPEEEPKDRGVFETETTQNIKGLLFVKENQTFQVNEFSPFLCMGRCNKSELTELFLWYAPYPSGVSILFFSILSPLRAHHWGTCSGWWLQHPLFSGGWCCFIHMG